MNLRHEWKHEINYADLLTLRQRLGSCMVRDSHARGGTYFIRSLYFDNLADKALREKLDGINHREKFRIRYYNLDTSLIHLEKKSKINGLGSKQSVTITKDETIALLHGSYNWMVDNGRPLLTELYSKMQFQGLRPKTVVDYTREAFIYTPGNVRVTIDYAIRTSSHCIDFLSSDCVTIPAGNAPIILEVKWDEYLPSIIRDLVQFEGRRTSAFSKYAACRIYG